MLPEAQRGSPRIMGNFLPREVITDSFSIPITILLYKNNFMNLNYYSAVLVSM